MTKITENILAQFAKRQHTDRVLMAKEIALKDFFSHLGLDPKETDTERGQWVTRQGSDKEDFVWDGHVVFSIIIVMDEICINTYYGKRAGMSPNLSAPYVP